MSYPVIETSGPGATSHTQLSDIGTLTHPQIEAALTALGMPGVIDHYNLIHIGTKTHAQIDSAITALQGALAVLDHASLLNSGTVSHLQLEILITNLQGAVATLQGEMAGVLGTPSTLSHTDLLDIGTNSHATIDTTLADVTARIGGNSNGFLSQSTTTFGMVGRIFTISPTGLNFDVWSAGTKYTKTATSVTIDDVSGLWFIYFNSAGVLAARQDWVDDLIATWAVVSFVYWDSVGATSTMWDERHTCLMDYHTHRYLHGSTGAVWQDGSTPGGFTAGDGSLDAHGQFTLTEGHILDEDIRHTQPTKALTGTIPILWLEGNPGVWKKSTTSWGGLTTAGSAKYNLNTAGNWTIPQVTNGRYVLTHLLATSIWNGTAGGQVVAIMGQAQYTSSASARTGANDEIRALRLAGLPGPEMVFIATMIHQCDTGYGNTIKARITAVSTGVYFVDWRNSALTTLASTTSVTFHSNLSGLANDDHVQYVKVSGRAGDVITIPNTTASTTTGTGALVVTGGLGVGGQVTAGGAIKTTDTTQAITLGTGSGIFAGGVSVGMALRTGGSVLSEGTVTATLYVQGSDIIATSTTASISPITGSGVFGGGIGVAGQVTAGGALKTTDATASTTTTTGSGLFAGGIGVVGQVTAGGALKTTSTTASTTTATGSGIFGGGVGVAGQVTAGGAFKTTDTTAATNTTTGSGIFAGGVGIAGALYVGGATNITGTLTGGILSTTGADKWGGFTSNPNVTIYLYKHMRVVTIVIPRMATTYLVSGTLGYKDFGSSGTYTLPADYRPTHALITTMVVYHDGATYMTYAEIFTTGAIRIYGNGFSFVDGKSCTIYDLNVTFIGS